MIVFNDNEWFNERKKQHDNQYISKISPYEEYFIKYCGDQHLYDKNA